MIGALLGLAAQMLHIALMLAAAPLLVGGLRFVRGRLLGFAGPPPVASCRDLMRLLRKQPALPDGASWLFRAAPAAGFAASLAAIALVPSFSRGMTTAPVADLLVVLGLLAVARGLRALADFDTGTSLGGCAAGRVLVAADVAEPALVLVVFIFALLGGGTNLSVLAAFAHDTGVGRIIAQVLAMAALCAVGALAARDIPAPAYSGRDLAMLDWAASLRLLVWLSLIALFLPPYMTAAADASPVAWLLGIFVWAVKIVVLGAALTVGATALPRLNTLRIEHVLGVALLTALLGIAVLFIGQGFA